MSLSGLLDTDVAVLGEQARAALSWWLGELRQMAGPLLAAPTARALVAERCEDGVYLLTREGRAAGAHAPGDPAATVALALPSSVTLVREVTAPPLPDREVRRMLALDIDRLTPFRPEAVYIALAPPTTQTSEGGPRRWRLAVAPREAADRAVAQAQAAGLQPNAVLAGAPADALDLWPAMRAAAARGAGVSPAAKLWLLVAVLLAMNLGAAIWRDVRLTDMVRAEVAEQQPVADRVLRLRRRIEAVDTAARAQIALRDAHDPLRALDVLTQALGDDVWLRRLALDDGALRIAGQRREGADATAMLRRSPAFADVADTDADPADPAAFEATARLAAPSPAPGR